MRSLKKIAVLGLYIVILTGSTVNAEEKYPLTEKVVDLGNNVKLELVLIQPAKFIMGSDNMRGSSKPKRKVELTKAYWIGKYEITNNVYNAVNGISGGDQKPKTFDRKGSIAFAKALAQKTQLPFRLLTEAEHVHARMAGTNSNFWWPEAWQEYAWFIDNAFSEVQEAGMLKPNPWGLYDICGNVHEYVSDLTSDRGYPSNLTLIDPTGVPDNGALGIEGISVGGAVGDNHQNGNRGWNFTFEGNNGRTGTRICLPAPELTASILNDYPGGTTYFSTASTNIPKEIGLAPKKLLVTSNNGSIDISTGKPGMVSVYNVSGKFIKNITLSSAGSANWNIANNSLIKTGLYIFSFDSGAGRYQVKVNIIQ